MIYSKLCSTILFTALISTSMAFVQGCSPAQEVQVEVDKALTAEELQQYQDKLNTTLQNPEARTRLIAKVMGSTVEDERHAYLKFHVFGYAGDGNLIPFFTMNNYIIQKWAPGENSTFEVQHYESAYYSKFDTNEPLGPWENPLTGEILDIPAFVLGPVFREYGPGLGDNPASFAPDPLNITMIGDRVYIPTLSRFKFPNSLDEEEWGPYSSGPITYWDSMLVFSADIEDVFDESKNHVDADIHMQNLVSWGPPFKMGSSPGRTMVRAYGQHIAGYDSLPDDIRANLEKETPEIFDLESWVDVRLDTFEFMEKLEAEREAGTLDIDQPDYVPYKVKKFDEIKLD